MAVGAGPGAGDEYDNAEYNGSTSFSSPSAAPAAISDNMNWVGNNTIRYDFSTFGDFTLPVELSSFSAIAGDKQVILKWVTESEVDNVGFEILRSIGENGECITLASYKNNPDLKGQLNSSSRNTYKFTDNPVVNN